MKKFLFAATASLAFVATPAFAQDVTPAGGFYAGVLAGIDSVNVDDGTDSESEEDILYGVTIGYDMGFRGGLVVGVEGEWSESEVGVRETDFFAAGDEIGVSAGRDLYAGLRVGYDTGGGMFYVKGGYTNAKAKGFYDDGTTVLRASEDMEGFRLGAGGEFPLSQMLALRAEYRYSDYGELDVLGAATGVDVSRHQGAVALLAKF